MRRIASLTKHPAVIAFVAALAVAGCRTQNQIPNTAADLGLGAGGAGLGGTAAPGSQQEFTVSVGDRVFFDTDSSVIRADAQATLIRQAQWLNQYPSYAITIEGHADERGTREYNLALGERRANAAKNYLVSLGISADRLTTVSYGKERPVALGSNEQAWARNRRAVTIVLN